MCEHDRDRPILSLVIPAFNEADRLSATLTDVLAFLDQEKLRAEVIVVDDGSIDGTAAVATSVGRSDARVVVEQLPRNRGKGAAIAQGVKRARGAHVVFFDADLPYRLSAIGDALRALEEGADLAIGARDLALRDTRELYAGYRRLASVVFNVLVEALLGLGIPDTQCGFKAFRLEIARSLFSVMRVQRFGFDVELLFLARKWRLRLARIPVHMRVQRGSSVRLGPDSMKMVGSIFQIRWRDQRGGYPAERPTQSV